MASSACLIKSLFSARNTRWQRRPSNGRPPSIHLAEWDRIHQLFLQHLCGFCRQLPLSSFTFRRYLLRKAYPTLQGQQITCGPPNHARTPSFFWSWAVGADWRTPCITSGYTAFGSPSSLSSSDFKVRETVSFVCPVSVAGVRLCCDAVLGCLEIVWSCVSCLLVPHSVTWPFELWLLRT